MTKPKKVDWLDPDDLRAVCMAQMGQSTVAIVRETGLTSCQVQYRLMKSNTKRSDYRNGKSKMAKLILSRMMPSDAVIRGMIKAQIATKGD